MKLKHKNGKLYLNWETFISHTVQMKLVYKNKEAITRLLYIPHGSDETH